MAIGERGEYHVRNVTVFFISMTLIYGVYIPILTYNLCKFNKMKQMPWLQNRYPQLTILTVISLISSLIFGSGCGFLYINGLNHKWLFIVLFFILMSFSLFTHSIVTRIWLLYFKTRINKALLNDQWQSIINEFKNVQKEACPSENANAFYLTNRKTYGNYHWMKKKLIKGLIFDFVLTLIMFGAIALVDNSHTAQIIFSVMAGLVFMGNFVIPLIFIVHIYRITPDFYDKLGLRDELLGTIKMYILSFVAFGGLCIFFVCDQFITLDREGNKSMFGLAFIFIDWNVIALVLSWIGYLMVKRYPDKLAKMYNTTKRTSATLSPKSQSRTSAVTMSPVGSTSLSSGRISNASTNIDMDFVEMNDGKKAKNIKIKDILQHEKCFEVFIEHLAHEYCMEGLLSIIEFTQYRDYILASSSDIVRQIYNNPINHKQGVSSSESMITSQHTLSVSAGISMPTPTASTNLTETFSSSSTVFEVGNRITKYYDLPKDIVKSEIVYPGYYKDPCPHLSSLSVEKYLKKNKIEDDKERMKRYKEIAYAIFDKYIRSGSEYEINVSYQVRMKYMHLMSNKSDWINKMDDMDENELCRLFEDCYDEMIRLMSQSYSRFKLTEQFEKVRAVLN